MSKKQRRPLAILLAVAMLLVAVFPLSAMAETPPDFTEQELTNRALAEIGEYLNISADDLEKLEEYPLPDESDLEGQERFAKAQAALSKYLQFSTTELALKEGESYEARIVPYELALKLHWDIRDIKSAHPEYLTIEEIGHNQKPADSENDDKDQSSDTDRLAPLTFKFKSEKAGGAVEFDIDVRNTALETMIEQNPDLQKYADEISANLKTNLSCRVTTVDTATMVLSGVDATPVVPEDPSEGDNSGPNNPPSPPDADTPDPTNPPVPDTPDPTSAPDVPDIPDTPDIPDQPTPPVVDPTPEPTDDPDEQPTSTPEPTLGPPITIEPTPSAEPSIEPTVPPVDPSDDPTPSPTIKPTATPPIVVPTSRPTSDPPVIVTPTPVPTQQPTTSPDPTDEPGPTTDPTDNPDPTEKPTENPNPTEEPTESPDPNPTEEPTDPPDDNDPCKDGHTGTANSEGNCSACGKPMTQDPTGTPTPAPTDDPDNPDPTEKPTESPDPNPTEEPTDPPDDNDPCKDGHVGPADDDGNCSACGKPMTQEPTQPGDGGNADQHQHQWSTSGDCTVENCTATHDHDTAGANNTCSQCGKDTSSPTLPPDGGGS